MTTFIQPTKSDIAIRDELASVSNLEERDATRMIVSRIDALRARIEAGESPKDIAIDIHLRDVIGLNDEEVSFINRQTSERRAHLVGAVTGYHPLVLIAQRDGVEVFYTGRAGEGWVSENRSEAWTYSVRDLADSEAVRFNKRTALTGLEFTVGQRYV